MKFNIVLTILVNYIITARATTNYTDPYIPVSVPCPSNQSFIRNASDISQQEQDWINKRHNLTDEALAEYLTRANLTDFNATEFMANDSYKPINIGLAFSGGGYRAMLAGAGQLSALDSRVSGANESGLGGLLQASTYISGVSGGAWLIGSLAFNNWSSVDDILSDKKIWNLANSILLPYGEFGILQDANFWFAIISQVQDKYNSGFNTSITDYWGRAMASKFFADGDGLSERWSDIRNLTGFNDYSMPFPIILSDGRAPGSTVFNDNSTVFEINPFEMGSWDPSLYAFTDLKYLGSSVVNGRSNESTCVNGYDNAGFLMGTTSSVFNGVNLASKFSVSYEVQVALNLFLSQLGAVNEDLAIFEPNPFAGSTWGNGNQTISKAEALYLADGSTDGQNIPMAPLIQPQRDVDVILAFDNTKDLLTWPNGSSLITTYKRQFSEQGNGTAFPQVPTEEEFLALNFTSKPVFFGCYEASSNSTPPPIVVYTANRPFSFMSNVSTFDLSISDNEVKEIIQNGFETTSRYNLTLDEEYDACIGCAIIKRQQDRMHMEQTDQCKHCFQEYCWNGQNTTTGAGLNFTMTGLTNGTTDIRLPVTNSTSNSSSFSNSSSSSSSTSSSSRSSKSSSLSKSSARSGSKTSKINSKHSPKTKSSSKHTAKTTVKNFTAIRY